MRGRVRRFRPGAYALGALWCLTAVSCVSTFLGPSSSGTSLLSFRVENATASAVELVIKVMDANGELVDAIGSAPTIDIPVVTVTTDDVSFSTLTPTGAAAVAQADQGDTGAGEAGALSQLGAQASVRVPGFAVSEGVLACGPVVEVTATVDGTETPVLFDGDGTGTPGFDEGSVGESGERFLVEGLHFGCGQNVVVRIGDDGSAAGASASATARGILAVIDPGEPSPFDPVAAPGSGTGDDPGDAQAPEATSILVQIDNRASIIADVSMTVGTAAGDQSFDVSVPPDVVTEGDFACGTQLTFTARFPNTDRPPDQEPDDAFPDAVIVLTGDGTGAPGFDEASVSPTGERILIVGSHVNCGDTVALTILDDSAVLTPNGFNGVGVGAAAVDVLSAGADAGAAEDSDATSAEPDVALVVDNRTTQFVRLNVVGGAASLGQQLDVFLTESGRSEGALSCADRYTLTAYSLVPAALEGLMDQVLVVLQGDGTGTSGFDEGSIGIVGQRLLLRGVHYECGDAFEVIITDPGQPGFSEPDLLDTNGVVIGFSDFNSNGVQDDIPDRLGSGTVEVEL